MTRIPALLATGLACVALSVFVAPAGAAEGAKPFPAPKLDFETLDGHLIHAKDLAGKVVLLDFWATWCAPCVAALPELEAIAKRYDPAKFKMISVSGDVTRPTLRLFLETHPTSITQVWDGKGQLRKLYGVLGFPTYILIDRQGQVVH